MIDILLSALQNITPAGADGQPGNPLYAIGRLVLLSFMAGMTPMIVSKIKLWVYDGEQHVPTLQHPFSASMVPQQALTSSTF